jgi:hypothetical protein
MTAQITQSMNLSQADLLNGPFTITGSSSASAPVVINLISDLTLTTSSNLFTWTSGNWVLNGNGHTVTVSGVSGFNGLFGQINSGGTVQNLAIHSSSSSLSGNAGAIAQVSSGVINHVSSDFEIYGNAGGLVQTANGGSINNSFTTGNIAGINAGGMIEQVTGTVTMSGDYVAGNVTGLNAGGMVESVGDPFDATSSLTITNSYFRGNISGQNGGGLVEGINPSSGNGQSTVTATNVYVVGNLSGLNVSGVATGSPFGSATISHAYYVGSATGGNAQGIGGGMNTTTSFTATSASWNSASSVLTGLNTIWDTSGGSSVPFTLATHPGAYQAGSSLLINNPAVGNTLSILITDSTLNNGNSFYADQAAQYGIGGGYGNPGTAFVATYQWYANGVAIAGAIASTYKIDSQYLGENITVHVVYTNGNGVISSVIDSPTSSVNGVFDYAGNVSSYLDSIQANHVSIGSGIFQILDGAHTATKFTAAQLVSDADAFSLITSNHYLAGVADTAAHLQSILSSLISNAANLSSITLTDNGSVMLYGSNAVSLVPAFNSGNDFHTHALADMLYNLATDGTLYIKTSGGTLGTIAAGSSVLFADEVASTGSLATGNTTTFFHSSGGINGLTLPDLFTGPSSLGLTYQLIDSTQNAVVTGASSNDFIKVSDTNSVGKAVNGGGGNDVIDGGVGSTFVTGGDNHNDTFFLDGRAPGTSWSTITDFKSGVDKATIWGFVKGVSSIDATFTNYDHEGATGYQGLTLHFKNLLSDGQTSGSNPNLNSITLTGHTLSELGASSLADLNNQINNGTNAHILVGSTQDASGTHSYLYIH